jgi:hypothetical protein
VQARSLVLAQLPVLRIDTVGNSSCCLSRHRLQYCTSELLSAKGLRLRASIEPGGDPQAVRYLLRKSARSIRTSRKKGAVLPTDDGDTCRAALEERFGAKSTQDAPLDGP